MVPESKAMTPVALVRDTEEGQLHLPPTEGKVYSCVQVGCVLYTCVPTCAYVCVHLGVSIKTFLI